MSKNMYASGSLKEYVFTETKFCGLVDISIPNKKNSPKILNSYKHIKTLQKYPG